MVLQILVNTTDRTNYVSWPSFRKEDILNSQVDTLSFQTKKYGSKTWKPAVGDEIEVLDGSDKIFAGIIAQVEESIEAKLLKYQVKCKDWTHYLDRQLVAEKYENMTVNQIIADINTNYLTGFTIANVNCGLTVVSITFNRLPVSKCLQLLAEQVNYNWYVDYNKDIHFFSKNSEAAPFNLTDGNGKYIFNSLEITDDLSQIKNRVLIRGGEMVGGSRTENHQGDGAKKTFALGHKFAAKPTVKVGGVTKTVGIDFLDQDAGFDCLWNYNEKYIRFVSAPANATAIEVINEPYIPIIVQVQDDASIAQYGVYEFAKTDKTIKTKDEAKQYGLSQIEAYAAKIQEGSFQTYESGLRSGQIINIQSDIRGINENFLIQRVGLRMRGPSDGEWTVKLATLRTMGIIEFLQKLLLAQNKQIVVAENEVLEKYYMDNQTVGVVEEISLHTKIQDEQAVQVTELIRKDPWTPEWVLAPYFPVSDADNKREMLLDISSFVY